MIRWRVTLTYERNFKQVNIIFKNAWLEFKLDARGQHVSQATLSKHV